MMTLKKKKMMMMTMMIMVLLMIMTVMLTMKVMKKKVETLKMYIGSCSLATVANGFHLCS